MIRLVQITHRTYGPRVAVVDEPRLRLIPSLSSVYQLAQLAIAQRKRIAEIITANPLTDSVDYEAVYRSASEWQLLSPIHHPLDSAHCFITGTGLTHKASAENRQSMHSPSPLVGEGRGEGESRKLQGARDSSQPLTDSMKMYRIGLEGGRPESGCIGASPEWFYKGIGTIVRAHNEALDVPNHAEDGGDEAEIAGVYLIGPDGAPHRIGLVQGNEFSDHVMEARNYLYLAQSKLRACSLGPELVIDADFSDVPGQATIEREGRSIWAAPLASGEKWMCHSLANMEHHHFKHAEHRRPGDLHVHFFGADMFSFKDRIRLQDGDVMQISFQNFGRPLRNPIRIDASEPKLLVVKSL